MKQAIVALILLICAAGGTRADVLSQHAFAEELRRAFLAAIPGATITIEGDRDPFLLLKRPSGSTLQLNLFNIYNRYSKHPELLQDIVQNHVAAFSHSSKGAAKLDPARIVPLIKDRAWVEELQRYFATAGTTQQPVFDDFNKELVIVYAEDNAKNTRYLTSDDDLGVPRDELRKRAIANLMGVMPKIEMRKHDDAFAILTSHPDYGASLLLLDSIWSGDQIKFDGDTVVAVPAKDVILVTGSRNRAGLKAVRGMAANLAKGSYGLIDTLFVYRDSKFVKFGRK